MSVRKKTLIIQPLPGLGDSIWFLPYFRAIARTAEGGKVFILSKPTSQIHKLLKYEDFFEGAIYIRDKSKWGKSLFCLMKDMKKYNFEKVWILHHSYKYALASFLLSIPLRLGYGFGLQKYFLSSKVVLPSKLKSGSTLKRIDYFVSQHGLKMKDSDRSLVINPQIKSKILDKLRPYPKPWCALGIGSSEINRQWGRENFSELAKFLIQEGYTVFLCCNSSERNDALWIKNKINDLQNKIVVISELSIDEITVLLSQMNLFIGNDSGLLNLSAVSIPSIGLFGTTPPLTYSRNICHIVPKNISKTPSMKDISVQHVYEFLEGFDAYIKNKRLLLS